MVNEYLTNVRMVEERGRAGVKALSDWLRRCKASVGEVKGVVMVMDRVCRDEVVARAVEKM